MTDPWDREIICNVLKQQIKKHAHILNGLMAEAEGGARLQSVNSRISVFFADEDETLENFDVLDPSGENYD